MKKFEKPEVVVVKFEQKDIIATSLCECDDCGVCEEGKNHCPCVDFN